MDHSPQIDAKGHYAELASAVGSLFLQWALLESEMAASLRHHLTKKMRARKQGYIMSCALFGSMRLKASRDTIKRVITELEYGEAALKYHTEFFSQISHIEDLRDRLAHHITIKSNKDYDGIWCACDVVATRSFKNYKIYEFDTETVFLAATDLRIAAGVVGGFLTSAADGRLPPMPTWRYKSSMLRLLPRRRQLSPQSMMLPPEPSQA